MVVLILGIAGFNEMENWWDTHNFKLGLPPWEETIYPTDTSDVDSVRYTETPDSAAVAYLNNNEKWSKDSLKKYVATLLRNKPTLWQ